MRKYVSTLLARAAAIMVVASVASVASAADLPRKAAPYIPPAPPPIQDWSGIYVGLEGGYGWGDQNATPNFPGHVDPDTCTFGGGFGGTTGNCNFLLPIAVPIFNIINSLEGSSDPAVTLGKVNQNGWLFGGHFGAQKQWGSWVLGLEGDVDAADIKGSVQGSNSTLASITAGPCAAFDTGCLPIKRDQSVSLESKIDMLASLRGKVGWSFAPDWLLYGTGGAAFGHVKNTLNQSADVDFCALGYLGGVCTLAPFIPPGLNLHGTSAVNGTSGDTMFGWAAGAGLDWKWRLDGGSALVLGVEYLHYGFPDQTITFADNNGASFSFTGKENVDVIKGRISYLFSIH
jgi:outer membrane immunogenic protein